MEDSVRRKAWFGLRNGLFLLVFLFFHKMICFETIHQLIKVKESFDEYAVHLGH